MRAPPFALSITERLTADHLPATAMLGSQTPPVSISTPQSLQPRQLSVIKPGRAASSAGSNPHACAKSRSGQPSSLDKSP